MLARLSHTSVEAGLVRIVSVKDTILILPMSGGPSASPGIVPDSIEQGSLLIVHTGDCRMAAFEDMQGAIALLDDPQPRQRASEALANSQDQVSGTVSLMKDRGPHLSLLKMICGLSHSSNSRARLAPQLRPGLLLQEVEMAHGTTPPAPPRPAPRAGLRPRDLNLVDRFIEQNLEKVLRIGQLASLVALPRYHFLRCFKNATGLTPLQYILCKRIARARQLLADGDQSIAEIAYASDFSSQSHLNVMFKRHVGVTPGAYMRLHRGRPAVRVRL